MKIPVWFKAREEGVFDIVCAELCGWGHYKMKGRVTFEPREAFDRWLERKYAEQEATQPTGSEATMTSRAAARPALFARNEPL
jgi:cytochrome c oxidase subunit 2